MDSKINDTQGIIESPRSVVIPFDMEGLNESNMCDLNKVFQINFSYNVELLKNLLEGMLKFQKTTEGEIEALKEENKEKNIKIRKLESKLSGLGNVNIKEEKRQKNEGILSADKDKKSGKFFIHNPTEENIVLKVSDSNNDVTNKIIVSNKLHLFILYFLEKIKWF